MDLFIFHLINQYAFRYFWLDVFGIFLACYFEYIVLCCLLLFLFERTLKRWKVVVSSLLSAVFARFVIVSLIRWFLPRARPFIENSVNLLLEHSGEPSFPSGHAAFYFAISTVVYYHNKIAGVFFFLATIYICVARIFVGIHWPSDILAGALVGIFSGWLLYRIFKKI